MKDTLIRNIYYVAAFIYIFLGTFFLDWSFRMVPPSSDATNIEIVKIVVQDSLYILVGLILFCATFLRARNRETGEALFKIVFYGGIVLIFGSSLFIFFINELYNTGFVNIFDIKIDGILFIPVIMLFANRKKIRGFYDEKI